MCDQTSKQYDGNAEREAASQPPRPQVAFLADAMLGRLARWLRLLGYNTLYVGQGPDHQIVARARAEGRVVLTRDRELARHKGAQSLLIRSQVLEEQIGEVVAAYPVAGERRCPHCNTLLVAAARDQVRAHVPPYVFRTQAEFRHCPTCDKYYWAGTHWQNVERTIERLELG